MRKLVPYTMPDGSRPASRLPVILSAVLAVAVVALLALNVYQYAAGAELKAEYNSIQSQLSEKDHTISELQARISDKTNEIIEMKDVLVRKEDAARFISLYALFFDSSARIVPAGSDVYHRYGCPELDISKGFFIFNIEFADGTDRHPCPECASENSIPAQNFDYYCSEVYNFTYLLTEDEFKKYINKSLNNN